MLNAFSSVFYTLYDSTCYKCTFSSPFNANPLQFLYVFPTATVPLAFSGHRTRVNSMADFQIKIVLNVINKIFMALFTCAFSFGGAVIGIITGAIKGQTTESGLVRGACVGAVTGAITALQLVDMMANGEPFSKVALLHSLLNGKVFIEWVSPAMLKAYQWQTSATEMSFTDLFDMDNNDTSGLSKESINKLPKFILKNPSKTDRINNTNCAICLHDMENYEEGRELPNCRHVFHLKCIDEWLIRQGSCPICRRDV